MAKYFLFLLLLANTAAYANDTQETSIKDPSPISSEIGFGYQASSGNSDSQTLNSNLKLTYTKGRYQTDAEAKLLMAKKNGSEDKQKISFNLKSKMLIRDGYYLYANGGYIDDRYGPYYVDSLASAGVGYRLFNNDVFQTLIDIGPGFRHQDPNLDEIKSTSIVKPEIVDEPVLQSTINMQWQPLKTLTFDAMFNLVSGKSNTTLETDLSITNSVTDNIALSLGFNQTYYTWVPEGMKQHDSTTTINLIYKI